MRADFVCIIGAGDTCKTTILTALDYALSPRTSLMFDDADFFNQDVSQDICIQITLSDWNELDSEIRDFFRESKFAQYKCGLTNAGPVPEPELGGSVAISVCLRVDKSLEPRWFLVKGMDESDAERVPLYATDRAVLGLSRLDVFSDNHFTWARNTILTRLSSEGTAGLNIVVSELAREMRQSDVSAHQSIAECQSIANEIRKEAQNNGVKLSSLAPKIDVHRQSMTAGAISLHENSVPLRNKGTGSKRLIAAAMQMKLHGGKNIALIDELEMGLEPHRIRGIIHRLKKTQQQVFTTTHSPVVIRELEVGDNELYVCRRDSTGGVFLESMATVPGVQGALRQHAEAFLGSRIVACEGPTEIGALRAYDVFRFDEDHPPIWSLATSYFNCGGGGKVKVVCPQLVSLGYETAAVCDNDADDQLSSSDIATLKSAGVYVCQWSAGSSTEGQLFLDLPWSAIGQILSLICEDHDTLELATVVDSVRKHPRLARAQIGGDIDSWPESPDLRKVIGDLANEGGWIKRIDYASKAFRFAFLHLPGDSTIMRQLGALWNWIERGE
jgi:putative ATP-dependent endonuclease of OLD family